MPIQELIKGNRLEDILVGGTPGIVAGYRLHTGPLGTETDDTSFCGDSRVMAFYTKDYTNLEKSPQGVCEDNLTWPAWLLTHEAPDNPVAPGGSELICYPIDQGQPVADPPAKSSGQKERAVSEKTPRAKKGSSDGDKEKKKGKKS